MIPIHLQGRIKRLYVEDDYLWCQHSNAADEKGITCSWDSDNANAFCLLGAIYKVYKNSRHWSIISHYLSQILGDAFWEGLLLTWNDTSGRIYPEVIEFLERHKL